MTDLIAISRDRSKAGTRLRRDRARGLRINPAALALALALAGGVGSTLGTLLALH